VHPAATAGGHRRSGSRELGPVDVEDLSQGGGQALGFLSLLGCCELPLVAGHRRWPAPAPAATAAPATNRGVEADRSGAAGESGTASSKMDPSRPRPHAGPDSPAGGPNTDPRSYLERKAHASTLIVDLWLTSLESAMATSPQPPADYLVITSHDATADNGGQPQASQPKPSPSPSRSNSSGPTTRTVPST